MKKILIIGKDAHLVGLIKQATSDIEIEFLVTANSERAIELLHDEKPDLTILDLNISEPDALQLWKSIRLETDVPVMVLGTQPGKNGTLFGVEIDADVYSLKSFDNHNLTAHIQDLLGDCVQNGRSIVAPSGAKVSRGLTVTGDIKIDSVYHRVYVDGVQVHLRAKEFKILEFLAKNRGQVFKREKLLEVVWGSTHRATKRTVDTHICTLRMKIETNPQKPTRIVTVREFGYKLEC